MAATPQRSHHPQDDPRTFQELLGALSDACGRLEQMPAPADAATQAQVFSIKMNIHLMEKLFKTQAVAVLEQIDRLEAQEKNTRSDRRGA